MSLALALSLYSPWKSSLIPIEDQIYLFLLFSFHCPPSPCDPLHFTHIRLFGLQVSCLSCFLSLHSGRSRGPHKDQTHPSLLSPFISRPFAPFSFFRFFDLASAHSWQTFSRFPAHPHHAGHAAFVWRMGRLLTPSGRLLELRENTDTIVGEDTISRLA